MNRRLIKYLGAMGFGAIVGFSIIGVVTVLGGTVHYTWAVIGCPVLTAMFTVFKGESDNNG